MIDDAHRQELEKSLHSLQRASIIKSEICQ